MRLNYITLILLFFWAALAYSQDSVNVIPKTTSGDIDLNYLNGVKSDNLGLRASSAYYLGERKSEKAVIPLMEVLRSDTSSAARIMAALSLYKIGNERGIFAIKQAIQFDADEQVKKMCSILYQMYSVEKDKNK
jgi:HEAT repeats